MSIRTFRPTRRIPVWTGVLALGVASAFGSASGAPVPPPVARVSGTNTVGVPVAWPGEGRADGGRRESAADWVRLGEALMQEGRETAEGAVHGRAREAFERALALESGNIEARVGLAWVFNTVHDFARGRSWAEQALALDPRQARAWALLGDAAVELGDYEDALVRYQEALDLNPDLSALSRAAHLAWLMGDGRKGRWLMGKAIGAGGRRAEHVAWCRARLALMLWHEGALLPARQNIELALGAAPANALVLAIAGRIRAAEGDYSEAVKLYRRSVEVSPTHEALAALVDLYRVIGAADDAEIQYQRVLAFHGGGSAHAHPAAAGSSGLVHAHGFGTGDLLLAGFLARHGRQVEAAVAEARAGYGVDKSIYAADHLAWCLYAAARYREADAAMRQALRWNTPDARLYFHAGMIRAKLGDTVAAARLLHRALGLNARFDPVDAPLAVTTLGNLGDWAKLGGAGGG